MNVIVVNQNSKMLEQLDIDIIKKIDGQYSVSELLSKFVNLYFEKLIIDVTAIENYKSPEVMADFAKKIDASRVILLLSGEPEVTSTAYLANLVRSGIYNFTRNIEGIKFLYGTPNTLDNVKYLLEEKTVQNVEPVVSTGIVTPAPLPPGGSYSQPNASTPQTPTMSGAGVTYGLGNKKIIGLSNLTVHAGASTLTNMMVRQLNNHHIPAKGIEMSRQDLLYYRSDNLISCMNRIDLERALRDFKDIPAIIIDLNEFPEASKFCSDILYLVEPSFIRLTKCIKRNKNAFIEKKDEKIVLNMSFVSEDEVYDFEIETGVKVFENIPPINDRDTDSPEINRLLSKLGFNV